MWIESLNPTPEVKARVLDGLTSEGVLEGRNYDEEKRNAGKPAPIEPDMEPVQLPPPTQVTMVSREVEQPVVQLQTFASTAMVISAAATVVRNPFHWVNYSENYEMAQQFAHMTYTRSEPTSTPNDSIHTEETITLSGRLWPYNTDFYLHPESQRQDSYLMHQQYLPLLNGPSQTYVPEEQRIEAPQTYVPPQTYIPQQKQIEPYVPPQTYVPPPQQTEPPQRYIPPQTYVPPQQPIETDTRRKSKVAFTSYGRIPDHTSVDDVAPETIPIVQQVGSYSVAPPESSRSVQQPLVNADQRNSRMNYNTSVRPVSTTEESPRFPPPAQREVSPYVAPQQQTSTSFNTGRRPSKMAFHSYFRPVNEPATPGQEGAPQYSSAIPQSRGAPQPVYATEQAPTTPYNSGRRPSKMAFHTYFRPTNEPDTPNEGPSQPFPSVQQQVQARFTGTAPPNQPTPPIQPPQSYPVQEMRGLSLDSGRRPSGMQFHRYFQADHS